MKKRGFGKDKYNGFGGKVEKNETIEEAAMRETFEESSIKPIKPEFMGYISMEYDCEPHSLKVHLFKSTDYEGEVKESEEMAPKWFSDDKLPFNEMWKDDPHWMPFLLNNKYFGGTLEFEGHDTLK